MALGNTLGVQYSSNVSEGGDWSTISNLVGWWDFSDINTLFKDRDSYDNPVTANDDLVGRVKNKAGGANKLGEFLSQVGSDTYRPQYKTGGVNGQSYVTSGGTSQKGFVGGVYGSNYIGGITGSKFSDCAFTVGGLTMIGVCKQDTEDISGSNQMLVQLMGADTSASDSSASVQIEKVASTDVPYILISYGSDEAVQAFTGGSSWDTDDRIVTLKSGPGTNGAKVMFDTTVELQATLNDAADPIDMSLNTVQTGVCIGALPNASGYMTAKNWDGRIYEVLIYDKVLSDDELSLVHNYLNDKYALY